MQTARLRASLPRPSARTLLLRRVAGPSRSASTSETPVVVAQPINSGFRSALKTSALVLGTGLFIAYYYDSRSLIHQYVVPPLMRATLDPEAAHRLALRVLGTPFAPKDRGTNDDALKCTIWDIQLPSPVGLAAGFDKDGEAIDGLFGLGFDWVEIGSVTPKPQPGNPKPRVFTLPEDNAMINRYGFPSQGHNIMLARLRSRRAHSHSPPSLDGEPKQVLAVNLGKNKSSAPDSIADYLAGVKRFGSQPDVDVLVINVSSPNTPGLRGLQNRGMLEELLEGVCKERDEIPVASASDSTRTSVRTTRPKIVLKIAPDLDEQAIQDVAEAVRESKADGVIVSNTTIQRPNLQSTSAQEQGGLSGIPLLPLSLRALSILRSHLPADIPIIGCGGISSGADALAFARAGATTVQLYTSFGYSGVGTARRIKDELTDELRREGTTWAQVVEQAKAKAWVKPQGQQALDEGEKELRDMLDVLGKQLSAGEEQVARLEDKPTSDGRSLGLDNETKRIAELAEAAIAPASPRGGERLTHAQRAPAMLPASNTRGGEGSELAAHEREGKGALERRRADSA